MDNTNNINTDQHMNIIKKFYTYLGDFIEIGEYNDPEEVNFFPNIYQILMMNMKMVMQKQKKMKIRRNESMIQPKVLHLILQKVQIKK